MSVSFCGLELAHPIINGSGTFDAIAANRAFAEDLRSDFPFAAYVSKTITLTPRAVQQRRPLGAHAVAKAEQHGGIVLEPVLEDRQRRDTHAAADEDRTASARRRREATAEGPQRPEQLSRAELTQPPRSRADVLEQEMRLAVGVAGDREGTR